MHHKNKTCAYKTLWFNGIMNKAKSKPLKIQKKEKLFVEEYLSNGFNATDAYQKHVASKTAKRSAMHGSASDYLRRANVQQYLEQRLEERRQEIHVDQNYVIRKYLEIVESDYVGSTQYLTKDELDRMPQAARKLVISIESHKTITTRSYKYGNETTEEEQERYKVTFMCKNKALEALGKHTGAFMKDNITLQGNIETKSFTEALKELDI